jgi:hypothetical protein
MISCKHGSRRSAVVCRHLLDERVRVLRFVENSDDPVNLQAWCGDCEKLLVDEGGEMTARFRAFNDFALVCDLCYANIKTRHTAN